MVACGDPDEGILGPIVQLSGEVMGKGRKTLWRVVWHTQLLTLRWMAAQKVDIQVTDLSDHQESVTQLHTGEEICIICSAESAQLQVQTKAGQLVGILVTEDENTRQLLKRGRGVVRSLRKQQGAVVQVLLRVTDAPPQPLLQPSKPQDREIVSCVLACTLKFGHDR